MKTELEKMRSGELYSFADSEVTSSIVRTHKFCAPSTKYLAFLSLNRIFDLTVEDTCARIFSNEFGKSLA